MSPGTVPLRTSCGLSQDSECQTRPHERLEGLTVARDTRHGRSLTVWMKPRPGMYSCSGSTSSYRDRSTGASRSLSTFPTAPHLSSPWRGRYAIGLTGHSCFRTAKTPTARVKLRGGLSLQLHILGDVKRCLHKDNRQHAYDQIAGLLSGWRKLSGFLRTLCGLA